MQETVRFGGAAILASLMLVMLAGMGSAVAEISENTAFDPTSHNNFITLENTLYFDRCVLDNTGLQLENAYLSSSSAVQQDNIYISAKNDNVCITYLDNHNLRFELTDNENATVRLIAPEPCWVKMGVNIIPEASSKAVFDAATTSSYWFHDTENLWIRADIENNDNNVLISWVFITLTFDSTPDANSTLTISGTVVDDNGTAVDPIASVYLNDSLTGLHDVVVANNTFSVSYATSSQVGATGQIYAYGTGSLWESLTSSYTVQSATTPDDGPSGLILPSSGTGIVTPAEVPPPVVEAPPDEVPEVPADIPPMAIVAGLGAVIGVLFVLGKRQSWW